MWMGSGLNLATAGSKHKDEHWIITEVYIWKVLISARKLLKKIKNKIWGILQAFNYHKRFIKKKRAWSGASNTKIYIYIKQFSSNVTNLIWYLLSFRSSRHTPAFFTVQHRTQPSMSATGYILLSHTGNIQHEEGLMAPWYRVCYFWPKGCAFESLPSVNYGEKKHPYNLNMTFAV